MDIGRPFSSKTTASKAVATRDRSIGALLVSSGKISISDAETILRHARAEGLRFGDAAVRMGFVTLTDVQHALACQFDYPYLPQNDASVSRELLAALAPFSAHVEALRALRTQLMLRWFEAEAPHKALAIVSAGRGEGRSYMAANLAVVFSQLGERTLLIDADLRSPRQHQIFHLHDRFGLSALLSDRGDENSVHRIPKLIGLSVLPAGAIPPNPLELLGRPAFPMLLQELSQRFDVILVDTPAVERGADFQNVVSVTKGALVIARRNVTRVATLNSVAEAVVNATGRVVGVALNEH